MTEILNAFAQAGIPLGLVAVVFLASLMQAVTGIGFGVIAGPMLLVAMGSATAIQVSVVLSLLIAVILAPGTLPRVNRAMLTPLLVGVCLGTPFGALAIAYMSIDALKLGAAAIVGVMTLVASGILARYPLFEKDTVTRRVGIGMVSGILNTALAMPGPAIAAYATAIKSDKNTIRATTLVSFLFAYPLALLAQSLLTGLSGDLLTVAGLLAAPTVAGTLLGMIAAPVFNEVFFRWLTLLLLLASIAALILG